MRSEGQRANADRGRVAAEEAARTYASDRYFVRPAYGSPSHSSLR
jgi:hypothetical protein